MKVFKLVSVLTGLKLTNIQDRTDVDRLVFPSPVRFFPKKEISEDWSDPGFVQKRLKNRTGPNLEALIINVYNDLNNASYLSYVTSLTLSQHTC